MYFRRCSAVSPSWFSFASTIRRALSEPRPTSELRARTPPIASKPKNTAALLPAPMSLSSCLCGIRSDSASEVEHDREKFRDLMNPLNQDVLWRNESQSKVNLRRILQKSTTKLT